MYHFQELRDKTTWNNFIRNFPYSSEGYPRTTFVQAYEWIEFQEKLGNKTYPLGIYDSEEKLVGVAAGVHIHAKRGKYIYFRNGPVFDFMNKTLAEEFIDHVKRYCKKENLWFGRMSPLVEKHSKEEENIASLNLPNFQMHDVEGLDMWVMRIEEDEEALLSSIKKKTRYEIRKAEKEGVTFEISDDIETFYSILQETKKRKNWTTYSLDYVKNEFETFRDSEDSSATLILMKYKGEYIAGGVFIHFADQTFYQFGATASNFNKIPAAYLMIWEMIKIAKQNNSKFFNFWGITPEHAKDDHPWTGFTRFKHKFPGAALRWSRSKDIPASKKYWLTNTFERIDKRKKGY